MDATVTTTYKMLGERRRKPTSHQNVPWFRITAAFRHRTDCLFHDPESNGSRCSIYFVSSLSFLRKHLFPGPKTSGVPISFESQSSIIDRQILHEKCLLPPPPHHQQPASKSAFFLNGDPQGTYDPERKAIAIAPARVSPGVFRPTNLCCHVPVFPELWITLRTIEKAKRCENENPCIEYRQGLGPRKAKTQPPEVVGGAVLQTLMESPLCGRGCARDWTSNRRGHSPGPRCSQPGRETGINATAGEREHGHGCCGILGIGWPSDRHLLISFLGSGLV